MAVAFVYNGQSGTFSGANYGCYGVVTGNTANTITASAGWTTKYNQVQCSSPSSSPGTAAETKFIVEPNWGSATTLYSCAAGSTLALCGGTGITMVAQSFNVIGGSSGNAFTGAIKNVFAPGGQINANPNYSTLENVSVTRPDWLSGSAANLTAPTVLHSWDMHISQTIANAYQTFFQNWTLPALNVGDFYTGPYQKNYGTVPITWDCEYSNVTQHSCITTGIGGRSNPSANDNHLEVFGGGQNPVLLGPPIPTSASGLDLAGINMNFSGGRSTGTGAGGIFNFYGSQAGSSGSTVNADTNLWASIPPNGIIQPNLGTSTSPACPNGPGGALTLSGCLNGGLSGLMPSGLLIAATANTSTSSTVPGTNQGIYYIGHVNATQGVNTLPTEFQLGDCGGGGRAIAGTATDTVLYSDIPCTITHARADTTAVTETIPIPSTLHNNNPLFVYENDSNQTDILSPTTYNIATGHSASASTVNVASGTSCRVSLDPSVGSTWEANCHQIGTSGGGDSITTPNSTLVVGGTSTNTTLDLAGSAGEIMAGATPALTYTPMFGKSGTAGTLSLFPASGNFTTTLGSAATASNTFLFPAAVFPTGHTGYCVTSSTTCTWTIRDMPLTPSLMLI